MLGVWRTRREALMMDMMSDDDMATLLLDRLTAISAILAQTYAEAGCDILHLGDDIGMQSTPMMSVEMWRTWLKPRLKQVIDAAKSKNERTLIFYHSCGFIEPFIDDLIECGIDILNPIQPESMSFASLHERYADRLSFWGTIGTQTTMPFGTPEVPWENIMALFEARCAAAR